MKMKLWKLVKVQKRKLVTSEKFEVVQQQVVMLACWVKTADFFIAAHVKQVQQISIHQLVSVKRTKIAAFLTCPEKSDDNSKYVLYQLEEK